MHSGTTQHWRAQDWSVGCSFSGSFSRPGTLALISHPLSHTRCCPTLFSSSSRPGLSGWVDTGNEEVQCFPMPWNVCAHPSFHPSLPKAPIKPVHPWRMTPKAFLRLSSLTGCTWICCCSKSWLLDEVWIQGMFYSDLELRQDVLA